MLWPKVAVCIPTCNQAQFLEQSVRSVMQQDYPEVEIWIGDDASTDYTPEVVEALRTGLTSIHYHRHPANVGISANNNWLFAQPKTEFIVRLDSDDLLFPDYFREMVGLLMSYPQAGFAHAAVQEIDEEGKNTRVRRLGGRTEYQPPDEALRRFMSGYRVAANICAFRADMLSSLGYYRAGMNFAEDWDLAIRAAAAGWGNAYSENILASYRVWSRPKPQTLARKIQELEGCARLYDESVEPAFRDRQWSLDPVVKQRQKLALSYSMILDATWLSSLDCEVLASKLRLLGDSIWLSWRMVLLRHGCGELFRWRSKVEVALKDLVKTLFQRLLKKRGAVRLVTSK